MNLDCRWELRRAANKVMRSVHQQRKDSNPEKQIYATTSGEPMCHDAVRTSRAEEFKHMQGHNVFEVVWLSEVKSLTKVRSVWLQDMERDAVNARFVAQQVAYGERDDVLQAPASLRLLEHCWHWRRNKK